ASVGHPRAAAACVLPVPRLQHGRLEPPSDPPPYLGRAAALLLVVGDPQGRRSRRGSTLALAPRRRAAHSARGVHGRTGSALPADASSRLVTEVAEPPATPAAGLPACPYVGLTPFGEADAPFFFGREDDRRILISNLRASRLTLVYGPSGVGKSSLLHAGVMRDLRSEAEAAVDEGRVPETVPV